VAQQSRRRRRLLDRRNFHPPLGPGKVVSDAEVRRGVTPRFPAAPRTRCCEDGCRRPDERNSMREAAPGNAVYDVFFHRPGKG
jgi:hypothetical protein